MRFFRLIVLCAGFVMPQVMIAATYDLNGIKFETTERQSIWATGSAIEVGTESITNPEWDRYEAEVQAHRAAVIEHEQQTRAVLAEKEELIRSVRKLLAFEICSRQNGNRFCDSYAVKLATEKGLLSPLPPAPIEPKEPETSYDPLAGRIFLGDTWNNKLLNVGGIAGGKETVTLPNPALFEYGAELTAYSTKYAVYQGRLGTYKLCKKQPFGGCGKRPKAPKKPTKPADTVKVTINTETGAEANLSSSGAAGLDLNYQLDGGSFDASVFYNISADVPDVGEVKPGEAFSISGTSSFTAGSIDTQSPTVAASLDAVIQVEGDINGALCLVGVCTSGGGELDIDVDAELVRIDANGIVYLDGVLPNGIAVTAPAPKNEFTDATGSLSVELTVPILNASGSKKGETLFAKTDSDFIDLNVDLDRLLTNAGLFPSGELEYDFDPIDVTLKLFDFLAGPNTSVFQEFTLKPTLMVDFGFDRPVEILGNLVSSYRGVWDSLPEFTVFGETLFQPVFSVAAMLQSKTGLSTALELTMEFLAAEVEIGSLLTVETDPLFETKSSTGLGVFSLFDDSFAVTGFGTFAAPAFLVGSTLPAVPIPGGLPLLASGLVCALWVRCRSPVPVAA